MGGGRGRLGHRPSPPPTQGLRDCECQQPRQPRAQKTGTWALAGGEGGQDASVGLGWASLAQRAASCGEQRQTHTCTHTPWKHLPRLGPFLPSLLLPEAHQRWGMVSGTHKPLKRRPPLLHMSLGQPPCYLDGDHYCFRGTGKKPELQSGPESRKRRAPLFTPQGTLAEAWTALESCPKGFTPSLTQRGCWGWGEALPCPQPGPGAPPQAARRPKSRVGSRLCPSCLPAGVQTQSQDKKILW